MDNLEQFQKIKQEAEDFYKAVDTVVCPYLKSKIKKVFHEGDLETQ